jgi:thymidylate synthase
MIHFHNATSAFEYYWDVISRYGVQTTHTKAYYNAAFRLDNPELNIIITPERKWKLSYAEKEWAWYLSGNRSVAEIKQHAKIWDRMHQGDDLVWSNYGYWWKRNDQLERVKQLLREDPETRRAIVVHYDVDSVQEFSKDTPCNVMLNFYITAGRLHLTVFARSIDVWFGFCNDQYMFAKLLLKTASELSLPFGTVTFFITNLHVYNNQIKTINHAPSTNNHHGLSTGNGDSHQGNRQPATGSSQAPKTRQSEQY